MNMNIISIDVSKGKSMVTILRPYGEIVSSPFETKRTFDNIRSLIKQIKSIEGESRIIIERTAVITKLSLLQVYFVTAINPKLIKDFSDNSLRKVKSDAIKIARYTLGSWTDLKQYSLMDENTTNLPEYPVVITMKSVGTSLESQLMAEIGDVTRFTHKGAITAFAGIEPSVNASGTYAQKSVPISKRCSAVLRKNLISSHGLPCQNKAYSMTEEWKNVFYHFPINYYRPLQARE